MSGVSTGHVHDPQALRRVDRRRVLAALFVAPVVVALLLIAPAPVHAFGTINGLGQRAEHERITRAALACAPGVKSTGDCFEPRSIDQLAGHSGTFGGVGAPDLDEFSTPAAHCDDADFLNVPGYPQSRAAATAALMACIAHLRTDFQNGIAGADGLFDSDGELVGSEVDLTSDCTFAGGFAGRKKCNAIEGFGRALHGAQDFYSHSNWADESDPTRAIGVNNPPGLNLPGPSPILDLAGTGTPAVPVDLTTGYYAGVVADLATFCTGLLSGLNTRITHACLNKDEALIDPTSGTATDAKSTRGRVLSNEQKAVSGAIAETRRQWADFRAALISRYGADIGHRMALAITQDVPKVDLVFSIDTTGSMSPYIAAAIAAANDVVDALSGRGSPEILTDYRVGIVDYKDVDSDPAYGCPPDYDAVTDLAFSKHRSDIVSALGTLRFKVYGGCDFPEDVLSGVQRAVDFPWRDGVNKAIIVMGDAPGHDPENHSGLTSASVIAAALAVDPAVIYPILVGPYGGFGTDAFMANLAAGSGGQTFDGRSGGVARALLAAITAIVTAPPPTPTDTTPPAVTVTLPDAPAGQGGFFNGSQTPVTGSVSAVDPANVSAINCTDSAGGLTLGSLVGGGTGTASRTLTVSGDGQHDITCTATDGIGNAGAAAGSANTGTVKIDTSPPTASCKADPDTLWPPSNKLVEVATSVTITDAGSGAGSSVLTSATSNEPGVDDIQSFTIGEADVSGLLRAQRDGSGTGRIYTLRYTVSDVAGNTSTCDAQVSVPHDQSKG
jgi:hypothetical protein